MPAPQMDRDIPIGAVRLLARHLAATFMPPGSNECFVWAGYFAGTNGDFPVVEHGIGSIRGLLCDGQSADQVKMTCQTPGCVNPAHMTRVRAARPNEIGQPRRLRYGDHGPSDFAPKVTPELREKAISMLTSGTRQRDIASALGLSQSTISRITRNS